MEKKVYLHLNATNHNGRVRPCPPEHRERGFESLSGPGFTSTFLCNVLSCVGRGLQRTDRPSYESD